MLRFLIFGVGRPCAGLAGIGVYECVGGGDVVHFSVWMDNAFLPLGSFLMVAALCSVGKNLMVQSWWGHGSDVDGS